VEKGDRVRAGQILGLCGNSGNSSEPHLHFNVQDRARLFGSAKGLTVRFADYLAVRGGSPVQGQFVEDRRAR
jgi:murein DD-endopeptidase MepM/ murein hydrolase activator NlpD